jgi:hypothetical protein
MSNPITITATVAVWVSVGYQQRDLMTAVEKGNSLAAINATTLWGPPTAKSFGENYTRVGEADVTLRLLPHDDQVRMAVLALQQRLERERAEWLTKQQEILAEISKLQAISYDAESA